jgi:hypothetical protein
MSGRPTSNGKRVLMNSRASRRLGWAASAGGAASLMDGGAGLAPADAFGVGPDGIGGTADDVALRLGRDAFDPGEAFAGVQDTLNVTAFGLSRGRRQRPASPS